MLRDDDATVAVIAALRAWRGGQRIGSLGYDAERHHPRNPGAFPTVDELHAVTLRSWATVHEGDVLTPSVLDPFVADPCLTHFLAVVARECRSAKTGQNMSGCHQRETEP